MGIDTKKGLLGAGWVSTNRSVCRVFVVVAHNESRARGEAMRKMMYCLPDRNWFNYMYEVVEIPECGESEVDEAMSKSRIDIPGEYLLTI